MSVDKKPVNQIKTSTIAHMSMNPTISNSNMGATGARGATGISGIAGPPGILGPVGPLGATGQVSGTVLFWNNALQGLTGTNQYLGWGALPHAEAGSQIILPYNGTLSSMYAVTTNYTTGNTAFPNAYISFSLSVNGNATQQNVAVNTNASSNNNIVDATPVSAGSTVGMVVNSTGANCGAIVSIVYTYITDIPV